MKKNILAAVILVLLTITTIILPLKLLAAEYDTVVAGGQTEYEVITKKVVKIVHSIVPAGGDLASSADDQIIERIFISSISSEEINISYRKKYNANEYSTEMGVDLGRCKINSEIILRYDNSKPALRVKLIKIDMENGTATVIVTQFWPIPNSSTTKEVDPPTTPEAEPLAR